MATHLEGTFYGLEEDVATLLNDVKSAIAQAMPAVAEEAKISLHEHIENDVYKEFMPTERGPKDYERREEFYGLLDFDESHGILTVDVDRDSMALSLALVHSSRISRMK